MRTVMTGGATDAQIGALLLGLRAKGETIGEIAAAARVMRELATPVTVPGSFDLVDLVGTGGDGANLFNVSTAASFVAAAAGARVAKHGNRGVSSSSGSADVLESMGVRVGLAPEQVARAVRELGIGFMFAPTHHGAMRYAIGPRRELGMRTVFNVLGPMTNPAGVRRQLIGTFDPALCRPMAEVLRNLGSEHVVVVHAEDGLDELSLAAPSRVAELRGGEVTEYRLTPEELGLERQELDGLSVASADESAALIRDALGKRRQERARKAADMIALNAGLACYVAGLADSPRQGVALAQDLVLSGQALEKIDALAAFCACLDE
jgi:anthranilate phosphoribosyltransferase